MTGRAQTSVPALLRQQVDRWADAWLTAKFSRLLELRAQDPGPFNYPVAVFSEWRGKAFYLNVRYRARSRRPEDDFVVRHTRRTLTGFGRFDLAYFRHTDKWFTVYRALTAAECFREIEENEIAPGTTVNLRNAPHVPMRWTLPQILLSSTSRRGVSPRRRQVVPPEFAPPVQWRRPCSRPRTPSTRPRLRPSTCRP